jgi:hypothetical protein
MANSTKMKIPRKIQNTGSVRLPKKVFGWHVVRNSLGPSLRMVNGVVYKEVKWAI